MINLSKDINNIINKYLDYSLENLERLYNNKHEYKLKDEISIEDIFVKCSRLGYYGFYIPNEEIKILEQLEELPKPKYTQIFNFPYETQYMFKLKTLPLCNILYLSDLLIF